MGCSSHIISWSQSFSFGVVTLVPLFPRTKEDIALGAGRTVPPATVYSVWPITYYLIVVSRFDFFVVVGNANC